MLNYEDYTEFMNIHHNVLNNIAKNNTELDKDNYLEGNVYTYDGQNSGDFDSYCGISNPAQITIPLISGMSVVPFYVNVRTADTGPNQFINQGYLPC